MPGDAEIVRSFRRRSQVGSDQGAGDQPGMAHGKVGPGDQEPAGDRRQDPKRDCAVGLEAPRPPQHGGGVRGAQGRDRHLRGAEQAGEPPGVRCAGDPRFGRRQVLLEQRHYPLGQVVGLRIGLVAADQEMLLPIDDPLPVGRMAAQQQHHGRPGRQPQGSPPVHSAKTSSFSTAVTI